MTNINSPYESILNSVKKMSGIDKSDNAFNPDYIIFINTMFLFLNQMGLGPEVPFKITGPNEQWSDFIGTEIDLEPVKTYMSLKVKMAFDPPASSIVCEQINSLIKETEWRLVEQVETFRS